MPKQFKIMVSVTNPDEALDAMKGGADIIDVKNPVEGALGANLPWITRNIRDAIGESEEVSVTLGDMPYLPGTASLAALGAALLRVNYVKIGMLGPKNKVQALNISNSLVKTFQEFKVNTKIIIAGYADYQYQGCISPLELPKVAAESGAWGVLVDVKEKNGKGLFDYLSFEEIQTIVDNSHNLGLIIALAGSLGKEDIHRMFNLGVDIMGVRRGVSFSKDGYLTIDRNKVENLVKSVYPMDSSV